MRDVPAPSTAALLAGIGGVAGFVGGLLGIGPATLGELPLAWSHAHPPVEGAMHQAATAGWVGCHRARTCACPN